MSALSDALQGVAAILVVLVTRLGLVAAIAAVILAPVALVLGARRLWLAWRARARGLRRVGELLYRPDCRYAPGHTWVESRGGCARVGIDGLAQQILPWALAVTLPRPGDVLVAGQSAAIISCGEVEARVASPLSGKVVAVNSALLRMPSLVKDDGFGEGWLFAVEPSDSRWSVLAAGEAARSWMRSEAQRLRRMYEVRIGPVWRSVLRGPAPMVTPDLWAELTREFLRAR